MTGRNVMFWVSGILALLILGYVALVIAANYGVSIALPRLN
jgi:hypothetical protein